MSTVHGLADELMRVLAEEDPLSELLQGLPEYSHLLGDPGEAQEQRLRDRALRIAKSAQALRPTAEDPVTCAVIVQQAEALVDRAGSRLVEHTMLDSTISVIARMFTGLPSVRPAGAQEEQGFLTRLAGIPGYLAKAADRHRAGVAAGRRPVRDRVLGAVALLDGYLANPAGDPLRLPPLTGQRPAERDRLLASVVRPAFATYRGVLHSEIAPYGRSEAEPGLVWLPHGLATYTALARMHTTTNRTPEELHRTGLEVIDRLSDEFVEIGSKVFGVSTLAEVQHTMRTDPALRWGSAEELLAATQATIDRAEAAAPRWFGRLPSQRCVLEEIPPENAPHAPAAYYTPAAMDGSRPGVYSANTYRVTDRPRFLAEATAFHEAVPGHHFQITLMREMTDVPQLRKVAGINSYLEGWGLYCERLADEMGLYSDDLARLGMLATDLMRAARLVVDTGLHAFGWERQRVVDFLREHTVMPEVEIQSETDRYIEAPGQALAYLVGRLEIQRLRGRAESALGGAFDIRAFHDLVLGGGPLPMAVLDEVVAGWIETGSR